MKKLLLLAFLLPIAIGTNCFAQINWQWALPSIAPYVSAEPSANAIAADRFGNVFIGGFFDSIIVFGTDTLRGHASLYQDFPYIAKFDAAGNCKWARTAVEPEGFGTFGIIQGVATDALGDVYVTGYFDCDTITFGSTTLINYPEGTFTVKYDSNGNVLWAKGIYVQRLTVNSWAIAVDGSGSAYITGSFTDTIHFGNSVLADTGTLNYQIFVAKYDSAGNEQWAQGIYSEGRGGDNFPGGIAVDGAGHVFVSGSFGSDSLSFSPTVQVINQQLNQEVYTAMYDTAGHAIWARQAGPIDNQVPPIIAVDRHGNSYTTGEFTTDSMICTTQTLYSAYPLENYDNIFIVKYDINGNIVWTKSEGPHEIGTFTLQSAYAAGIATDGNENVYLSGWCYIDTLYIDSIELIQDPAYTIRFIAAFDSAGKVFCAGLYKGGDFGGSVICTDPQGYGFILGIYGNEAVFGSDSLPGSQFTQAYLAKFNCGNQACSPGPVSINSNNNIICIGDSTQICATTGFYSYLWNTGQTTPCIYATQAGNYLVTVSDSYGCQGASNQVGITVPVTPVDSIMIMGDTLSVNSGFTYQWFLNGSPLSGDTTNQIVATKGGVYTVQVTDSGCSGLSGPVSFTGVDPLTDNAISIYPNPSVGSWQLATGNAQLAVSSGQLASSNSLIGASLEVWDNEGQIIYQSKITSVVTEINLPALANGVYFLRIYGGDGLIIRKLVKI
jgi:hypothetical protein